MSRGSWTESCTYATSRWRCGFSSTAVSSASDLDVGRRRGRRAGTCAPAASSLCAAQSASAARACDDQRGEQRRARARRPRGRARPGRAGSAGCVSRSSSSTYMPGEVARRHPGHDAAQRCLALQHQVREALPGRHLPVVAHRRARAELGADLPHVCAIGQPAPARWRGARALSAATPRAEAGPDTSTEGNAMATLSSIRSPGVYIQEMPAGSRPIEGVGTAIAAFVGVTADGPYDQAIKVTNWGQYARDLRRVGRGRLPAARRLPVLQQRRRRRLRRAHRVAERRRGRRARAPS